MTINKDTLAALAQPFEESVIKTKKGMYGDDVRYVSASVVQKRLNDVLEGRWSFAVQGYEIVGDECLVLGSLTIDGVTKQQYGVSKLTKGDDGSYTSLGTDIKSSSADSLKRCAAGFGVLDSLYGSGTKAEKPPEKKEEPKNSGSGASGGNGSNGHKATNAQVRAIVNLQKHHQVSSKEMTGLLKDVGVETIEMLDKSQASKVIQHLQTFSSAAA
jgi:hypothetical protein